MIKNFIKKHLSKTIIYTKNYCILVEMEEKMKKTGNNEPISTIRGLANWWFNFILLGLASLMLGVVTFVYFYSQRAGMSNILYLGIGSIFVIELIFLYWINGVKNRAPEKLLNILHYIRGKPE